LGLEREEFDIQVENGFLSPEREKYKIPDARSKKTERARVILKLFVPSKELTEDLRRLSVTLRVLACRRGSLGFRIGRGLYRGAA
jgi:hypothetical protein